MHAYSLLDLKEVTLDTKKTLITPDNAPGAVKNAEKGTWSVRLVRCRNPWGHGEVGYTHTHNEIHI